MNLPRMSLHIGDYLKDTGHLRALEHGAYLLLIMHYWVTGGLPNDDRQLASIARMTTREWTRAKTILQAFFVDGWRHNRIDQELADAHAKYNKRAAAGSKGGATKASNATAMLQQNATNPNPNPILDFKRLGEGKRGPPRNGMISKTRGTVYIRKGTDEWDAYADDYQTFHGRPPVPDEFDGKWFKIRGEAAREVFTDGSKALARS